MSLSTAGLQPVEEQTTAGLFQMYDAVLRELARREVVRSTNNPIADYAEWLVARALGLTLADKSASGHDATGSDGVRYQIKARRPTPANASRQLSFIRGLDGDPFNIVIGVLFTPDHEVMRAARVPVAVVRQEARFVAHVNAWRMVLRDRVWDIPGALNITRELRIAAAESGRAPVRPALAVVPMPDAAADGLPIAAKTCRACGVEFPATSEYFYKWSRGGHLVHDGWYPVHKACYRAAREAREATR